MTLINTLIFDFDGTLVQSMKATFEIMNQLAQQYGFKQIAEDEIQEMRKLGSRELITKLEIPIILMPLVARKIRQGLGERSEKIVLVEGIKTVLKKLVKKGYKLGILTSNNETTVRRILQKYQIVDFDFVYSGSSIFGKDKVINKVLKIHNLSADQVVYIGDETRDIEAGKKGGVKTIAVTWGFNAREAFTKIKPDWIIDKPQELVGLFY